MRELLICFLLIVTTNINAQKKATVSGKVIDENDLPLSGVSVVILGKNEGIVTGDNGTFTITAPVQKAFALVFSHTAYQAKQKNFLLNNNENETIVVKLQKSEKLLQDVVISDDKERKEAGLIKINPKNALLLPTTVNGIEGMIKILVGSNNELSSQYNVRGGNYDENSIYINDFEVYRPYLVSNGQQEGLSFINPELTRNVSFYTGGFQAKYTDKMSSVLDIQYKKPNAFGGSVYASLLEQGFHLEGASAKKSISFIGGLRNRSNRNIISSQPTTGSYLPSSSDFQGYVTYRASSKIQLEALGIYSITRFTFLPESAKKTSSVFSPLFTSNLGLNINFDGQEKDRYATSLIGLTLTHNLSKQLRLKWLLSQFNDQEDENYDIGAAYIFGERDYDINSNTFGEIVNPLGQGFYRNFARNNLNIRVWNATHKGTYEMGKHFIQWGNSIERTTISDRIREWEYRDSAGYALPYIPGTLPLYYSQRNTQDVTIMKYFGFVQNNLRFQSKKSEITIQAGIRYHYNDLNKEWLFSPRVQASLKPGWKKDVIFRLAAGAYQQPPFYRELKNEYGIINPAIRAQKSYHIIGGFDYSFKGFGNKPFRLTTEAYYKSMWDIVPYNIDNVKIRYFGGNSAKAFATGIDVRLFGELVEGAESWLSIGYMNTKENLNNDYYYNYLNAAGQIITPSTPDKAVKDSVQQFVGNVRRPTDRRITVGLFLQDYLSTNKNFKVHLNIIYGSNMPFNLPNSARYRNALIIEPYIRVDAGFSVLLLKEKNLRRSHDPFRSLKDAWLSVEIFNLIDRENTISYQLIKDISNNIYTLPNRLTPRLINLKFITHF